MTKGAVDFSQNSPAGSFYSYVLFISSEGRFPSERLLQIVGTDCKSFSDRVLVEEVEYLENFLGVIEKLPKICEKYLEIQRPIACIIVDSVTAVMRLEFEPKGRKLKGS